MTQLNGKISPTLKKVEWAVYPRTGGGFIATPDDPKKQIKRYVWITEDGNAYYKEWGTPFVILGICKDIKEAIEKARKLG